MFFQPCLVFLYKRRRLLSPSFFKLVYSSTGGGGFLTLPPLSHTLILYEALICCMEAGSFDRLVV